MPTIGEVYEFTKLAAPVELAEPWDNVGLLVNCGANVTRALVALDITSDVIKEAEAEACQLIISHHPVIFTPMKSISRNDLVYKLIKKNISAICMHTNLDAAQGGVNDALARLLGLVNVEPFAEIGRKGTVKKTVTVEQLAAECKQLFRMPVKFVNGAKPIKNLAVVGGSGAMIDEAVKAGVDCLLTGEANHHKGLEAKERGMGLICAGHFATEFPVVPVLADRLAKRFPDMHVVVTRKNSEPFNMA